MKESDAKKKQCPFNYQARAIENLTVVVMNMIGAMHGNSSTLEMAAKGSADLSEANHNHACDGSGCAMWEPEYRLVEHEQPKDKEPPNKDGVDIDWQKRLRQAGQPNDVWFRYVLSDEGDCGLKSKYGA